MSNAIRCRAGLAARAEHWPWGSLHKQSGGWPHKPGAGELLDEWPLPRPADWLDWVHQPESSAELEALRTCSRRGRPFGDDAWAKRIAAQLGLDATFRPRGRPRLDVAATALT